VKVAQQNNSIKNLVIETLNTQLLIVNIIRINIEIETKYIGANLKNREMNIVYQSIFPTLVLSSFVENKNAVIIKKSETLVSPN
jgi:hypothetical protein